MDRAWRRAGFIRSSPEPKPNRITDDEDKYKSPKEIRQAGA